MIELLIFDEDRKSVLDVIDTARSIAYSKKLYEVDTFEFYIPISGQSLRYVVPGNRICTSDFGVDVLINTITLTLDAENLPVLRVEAVGLEDLYTRRYCTHKWRFTFNRRRDFLQKVHYSAFGKGTDVHYARHWPEFKVFEASIVGSDDACDFVDHDFTGDSVWDALMSVYQNTPFRIDVVADSTGVPRSSAVWCKNRSGFASSRKSSESSNIVEFSCDMNNLSSYKSVADISSHVNFVHLLSAEDGERKLYNTVDTSARRWKLREEWLSTGEPLKTEDGRLIPEETVMARMLTTGRREIRQKQPRHIVEVNNSSERTFFFGLDYELGDVVRIVDHTGMPSPARVVGFDTHLEAGSVKKYASLEVLTPEFLVDRW